jgi:hypothetical protein
MGHNTGVSSARTATGRGLLRCAWVGLRHLVLPWEPRHSAQGVERACVSLVTIGPNALTQKAKMRKNGVMLHRNMESI